MNITLSKKSLFGKVFAPPSKSYMHRALICAAMCEGETFIRCESFSNDTLCTAKCLESLGAKVEFKEGGISVGRVKRRNDTVVLDCGESGSTLRFMLPFVAALGQNTTFIGSKRLGERPIQPLCETLKEHGVTIICGEDNIFPCKVSGKIKSSKYCIDGGVSSQFISGLMMALSICSGEILVTGNIVSAPYIDITQDVMSAFGIAVERNKNHIKISQNNQNAPKEILSEGDFSNAAFWLVAGAISGDVECYNLSFDTRQGDKEIVDILRQFGADIKTEKNSVRVKKSSLKGIVIDAENIPDLVPILSVAAACAEGETVFLNTSRLREKESDRVDAVVKMISSLGGDVVSEENKIVVKKSFLKGATVDSFNDHRIAMSCAVASLVAEGKTTIIGAEAVEKSYPDFFEKFRILEERI